MGWRGNLCLMNYFLLLVLLLLTKGEIFTAVCLGLAAQVLEMKMGWV